MATETPTLTGQTASRELLVIRSTLLRSVLLLELYDAAGSMRLADLCAAIERRGFAVDGRISKVVSDSLRTELSRGRVFRPSRGVYRIGHLPRTTRWRCRKRVEAAHAGRAPRHHLHRSRERRRMAPPRRASSGPAAMRSLHVRRSEQVVAQRRNGPPLAAPTRQRADRGPFFRVRHYNRGSSRGRYDASGTGLDPP